MKVDAIIISHARTPELRQMTQLLVTRLRRDNFTEFNPIVVEGAERVKYKRAVTVESCKPFNYNQACNIGLKESKAEYIAFLNNDIEPVNGWAKECIEAMALHGLGSSSPWCPDAHPGLGVKFNSGVHVGHIVRRHVAGWAIVASRDTIDKIGGVVDPGVKFHYSDDLYIAQLIKAGIRHGLVTTAKVRHLESRTLHTLDKATIAKLTEGQKRAYLDRLDEGYKGVKIRKKAWQK